MARKKKKMELLEEIVDEIIEAPVIEKPKRTRKTRKKKVVEEVTAETVIEKVVKKVKKTIKKPKATVVESKVKPTPAPPTPIPLPKKDKVSAGSSDKINKDIPNTPTVYKTPVQIRRPGYTIVGH